MTQNTPALNQLLWQSLPEIYRERDSSGHLRVYLDSFGDLLEGIYQTLEQRYHDASLGPDCQPWMVPYFADLLGVSLVAPDEKNQRLEVKHAIDWRQRKGRLETCVNIARNIGGFDVVAHEAHTRLATTPCIGELLPSMHILGETRVANLGYQAPGAIAKRPGIPAVTLDFRKTSAAKRVAETNAASVLTDFGTGEGELTWQAPNRPHGVPLFRDSYQDFSSRTVDTRSPSVSQGHYHPKRLLLYAAVPEGFFPRIATRVVAPIVIETLIVAAERWQPPAADWSHNSKGQRQCRRNWRLWGIELSETRTEVIEAGTGILRYRRALAFHSLAPTQQSFDQLEESDSQATTETEAISAVDIPAVLIDGDLSIDPAISTQWHSLQFENLVFLGSLEVLTPGLHLQKVAVLRLVQEGINPASQLFRQLQQWQQLPRTPQLRMQDCLINWLWCPESNVELEHCTVLDTLRAHSLHASDSILLPLLSTATISSTGHDSLWLRYCCAPRIHPIRAESWRFYRLVENHLPIFYTTQFAQISCAVLSAATHTSIRFGAEDGGEMGAFHHRQYWLRVKAVEDKLREFLPVGTQPLVLFDRNWQAPQVPAGSFSREFTTRI